MKMILNEQTNINIYIYIDIYEKNPFYTCLQLLPPPTWTVRVHNPIINRGREI
jgi:hypothetical protein